MRFTDKLGILLLLFFTFIFYRFFLSSELFIANDWPLLFKESRDFLPFWSISWDYMGQEGIGGAAFKTFWIDLYTNFIYFISNLIDIPWWLSQRIFWILPFIVISILSSYKFSTLFVKDSLLRTISSLIYAFNTYILLIVAGGQFGIAFAYGLTPLVFYYLIKLFKEPRFSSITLPAISSGILIALDPRISILTFIISGGWYVIFIRNFNFRALRIIFLNFTIALLLNSYWIFPILAARDSFSYFSSYTSLEGLKFLSFADFSNSISLLHPNWPENIFGKTYFMKAEFILVPILAYVSLLFLMSKVKSQKSKVQVKSQNFNNNLTIEQFNNRTIVFFALLGLLGAFLAKGTSEPFGEIYLFLFQFPGINLFRDSTKFFILIALSYSVLIPFLLNNIPKYKVLLVVIFVIYWLIILKPGWNGELKGIFDPKEIPADYAKFNQFISNDKTFSRTLWVPKRQKYGFFDPSHPAVDLEALSKKNDFKENELQELGIKYVIVPYDSEGEIFLDDRKYSEKLYLDTVKRIEKIEWLKRVEFFGKLAIFKVNNPSEHFWSPQENLGVRYQYVNPTKYILNIKNAKKGDVLVFSESFDPKWIARNDNNQINSKPYDKLFNSFVLRENGSYKLEVYYLPQKYVETGLWFSGLTFLGALSYLVFGRQAKKW